MKTYYCTLKIYFMRDKPEITDEEIETVKRIYLKELEKKKPELPNQGAQVTIEATTCQQALNTAANTYEFLIPKPKYNTTNAIWAHIRNLNEKNKSVLFWGHIVILNKKKEGLSTSHLALPHEEDEEHYLTKLVNKLTKSFLDLFIGRTPSSPHSEHHLLIESMPNKAKTTSRIEYVVNEITKKMPPLLKETNKEAKTTKQETRGEKKAMNPSLKYSLEVDFTSKNGSSRIRLFVPVTNGNKTYAILPDIQTKADKVLLLYQDFSSGESKAGVLSDVLVTSTSTQLIIDGKEPVNEENPFGSCSSIVTVSSTREENIIRSLGNDPSDYEKDLSKVLKKALAHR
ncbi:MAG: hypothetical protein J7K00_03045 [Candidatus Diapherotrites archaeon]|nr:hypothetical protein [Candidatus Diapherotrites archaeon]